MELKLVFALLALAFCIGISMTLMTITFAMHDKMAVKPSTFLAGVIGLCLGLFISLTGI